MIARDVLRVGVVQLPEASVFQATVALEESPCLTDYRASRDCGEFVVSIGFVKWTMSDGETAKTVQATEKLALIGNADDDKVRMWIIGRKKRSADFKDRVAWLDDLLRKRQVGPDEGVDVRREGVLRELHDGLRYENKTRAILRIAPGKVKSFASIQQRRTREAEPLCDRRRRMPVKEHLDGIASEIFRESSARCSVASAGRLFPWHEWTPFHAAE
jgi:hypothetical protein